MVHMETRRDRSSAVIGLACLVALTALVLGATAAGAYVSTGPATGRGVVTVDVAKPAPRPPAPVRGKPPRSAPQPALPEPASRSTDRQVTERPALPCPAPQPAAGGDKAPAAGGQRHAMTKRPAAGGTPRVVRNGLESERFRGRSAVLDSSTGGSQWRRFSCSAQACAVFPPPCCSPATVTGVTVLERDPESPPAGPAFQTWQRPGLNQFHQPQFMQPRWRAEP
jgi:hypothetical protein